MPRTPIKLVYAPDVSTLYEPQVRQQLAQWGMSPAGVQQISRGQMPTDARDRQIVAAIVAQAAKT
jgi:hypothetical protein